MKIACYIFLSISLIGCVQICVPKCGKCNPCRPDIVSSEYDLSPILELDEHKSGSNEIHP